MRTVYSTNLGRFIHGRAEDALVALAAEGYRQKVDLLLTSPPFPLNRKKEYGNLRGQEYIDWLASFAPVFRELLSPTGSIVIELGNTWEPGSPTMSTLALRALLGFLERGEFFLCQQFVWFNPAKLPTPAQWVNVERIRVKDAYTHLWWMSSAERPKADNRNVLQEYSASMKNLLANQKKYNPGPRPSEHRIGDTSFLNDRGGAIPPNVLTAANTASNSDYLRYCRANNLKPHPARMPDAVVEFFVKFLTEPGDLVLDPFAGSNTAGAVAEALGRRWVSIEPNEEYIASSVGRFQAGVVQWRNAEEDLIAFPETFKGEKA